MVPLSSFAGVDRRTPRAQAKTPMACWTLENAYVTTGRTLRRRPPIQFHASLLPGSVGLAWVGGMLRTWHAGANTDAAQSVPLAGHTLRRLIGAWEVAGRIFAAIEYTADATGARVVRYWWNDASGSPVMVTDGNAPNTAQVTRVAQRIFAADGEVVRFCKLADPSDWTGTDDAGFLPAGRNAGGRGDITALGGWRDKLFVYYRDAVQSWSVGPDPVTDHRFDEHLPGIGTLEQESIAGVGDMTIFRAVEGYRAIGANEFGRPRIVNVGEPFDRVAQDVQRYPANAAQRAAYWGGLEAYVNLVGSRVADVFVFSTGNELSDWSTFTFDGSVEYPVAVGTRLYFRSGDTVVFLDSEVADDVPRRDQSAQPAVTRPTIVNGSVALDAVFPRRDGPGHAFVIASPHVTPMLNSGPSNDNASAFAYWPIPAPDNPVLLWLWSTRLTALDSVTLEVCMQGPLSASARATLEGLREVGGPWTPLTAITSWAYAVRRQAADVVEDNAFEEFHVSTSGGWRAVRLSIPSPNPYIEMRLRVEDTSLSFGGAPRGEFAVRSRVDRSGATVGSPVTVRLPFFAPGGGARKVDVVGCRIEQTTPSGLRVLTRAQDRSIRPVPRAGLLSVGGDTTGSAMKGLGIVTNELAPELSVSHDRDYELASLHFETMPLSQWA